MVLARLVILRLISATGLTAVQSSTAAMPKRCPQGLVTPRNVPTADRPPPAAFVPMLLTWLQPHLRETTRTKLRGSHHSCTDGAPSTMMRSGLHVWRALAVVLLLAGVASAVIPSGFPGSGGSDTLRHLSEIERQLLEQARQAVKEQSQAPPIPHSTLGRTGAWAGDTVRASPQQHCTAR